MDQPAQPGTMAEAIAGYRFAYLLTVSGKGAPHAVPASPVLRDGALAVGPIGRRTREFALARPAVSLVWPPAAEDGYTLIVDGRAAVVDDVLRIAPTRAVLHRSRPAPTPADPARCDSDCVELALPAAASGQG